MEPVRKPHCWFSNEAAQISNCFRLLFCDILFLTAVGFIQHLVFFITADDIADLNDRLIGLQQAKDAEKEQYESEIQKIRNEFQETKDQLTSENMILS